MHLLIQTLSLQLSGCQSLKEKRQRVGRLRDRFGKHPQIAVCESDLQDVHQQAEWTFVFAGTDKAQLQRLSAEVEQFSATGLDCVVARCDREWL